MTRLLVAPLAVATLFLGACTAPPAAEPPANEPADLQSIETVRNTYTSAYTAGNADAIGALYTDDAISQTNMQETARGRAAIVEQIKATMNQFNVRMDATPSETHTLGNNGWERGTYKMVLTPKAGGAPIDAEGRYMLILEKGANGWRVARDMDNTATPPPAPAPAAETKK
jgi:uncharacterized protein (TIGR02246 family)